MLYLAIEFNPIKPDVGLIFWTTIIFTIFWLLVGKFAFRPIKDALNKREHDIQDALDKAATAKEEMSRLKSDNEALLVQAREERALIIKEANDAKNNIIAEAKDKAKQEAERMISNAKMEIDNQKKTAMLEVKNEVGAMALDIAEKVIKKELSKDSAQKGFVDQLVKEINLS